MFRREHINCPKKVSATRRNVFQHQKPDLYITILRPCLTCRMWHHKCTLLISNECIEEAIDRHWKKKDHFIHKARPTWNRLGAFFGQHPSQASQGETLLTSRNQEAQQEWFKKYIWMWILRYGQQYVWIQWPHLKLVIGGFLCPPSPPPPPLIRRKRLKDKMLRSCSVTVRVSALAYLAYGLRVPGQDGL